MKAEIQAAIAAQLNAVPFVRWDRCVLHESAATVYGWIDRDDGRHDFLVLRFAFGTTTGLDGEDVDWLAQPGWTTSSAAREEEIAIALVGHIPEGAKACERVEDVFGALVLRAIELKQ